jgi:hypothetical protein
MNLKLPAIIKRDTAGALAKANEDLAATEAQIPALQSERLKKLLDAEPGEIERIDQHIADQHRAATVFRDRIAGLEQRLAEERAAQREADYKAWAVRVEAMPACRAADEKYERAKIAYAAATKEVILSRENVLRVYLEGELQPETVFVDYYLSLEPLGRDIQETWEIARGHADRRPPQPSEYLTRGCNADQPRGYAPAMRERLDEFIWPIPTCLRLSPSSMNWHARQTPIR